MLKTGIFSLHYYLETESAAALQTVLPSAKLFPDEKNTEMHQEDSAGNRQVPESSPC